MKSKIETQKKVCFLNEFNEHEEMDVNEICNLGFSKGQIKDYIEIFQRKNPIISLLYLGQKIIGCCFADVNQRNVMKPLSNVFLSIHTVSIDPLFRGHGLCYHLINFLQANNWSMNGFFDLLYANSAVSMISWDLSVAALSFFAFLIYKFRNKPLRLLRYFACLFMVGFSLALPLYLYDTHDAN